MLHFTLILDSLLQVVMKEGEVPPNISPRTNIYVDDANRLIKD